MTAVPEEDPMGEVAPLARALHRAAHLLPAQNPIDRFVHHNTLHAFEELPFEEAVVSAARTLGAQPFLPMADYLEAWRRGRIHRSDVEVEVAREVPAGPVAGVTDRRALVTALMLHPIEPLQGEALAWALSETDALTRLRTDLEPEVHHRVLAEVGYDEARALEKLWGVASARRGELEVHTPAPPVRVRVRDELVGRGLDDPDRLVNAVLIRWSAAYVDHGLAYWPMQERERGFFHAFTSHFRLPVPGQPWTARLSALLRELHGLDPSTLAMRLLERLGHPEDTWDEVVLQTLLALRGWAGMFQRLAERPDCAPERLPLVNRLDEYLAVRLLLDVSVAEWQLAGREGRTLLERATTEPERPHVAPDEVWHLFQLCQVLGISAHALGTLSPDALHTLLEEVFAFDDVALRRLWHRAYERRHRVEVLDAVVAHTRRIRQRPAPEVRAQCVFCIDDREESFRRHLEELAPWVKTYGYAGNYGISMYFRSATSGRPVALGPAGFEPRHLVEEEAPPAVPRWQGLLAHHTQVASQTFVRGALVTLGGLGAAVPLIWRILDPRGHARAARRDRAPGPLRYRRQGDERSPEGLLLGFSLQERVDIVVAGLRTIGLVDRFAPLVVCLGHGSTSVNNPHEAGYNCGACGGGRGGPNARLFATMANEPEVRAAVRARGIDIPESTWFVGGYHNTSEDGIDLYDLDAVPAERRPLLDELVGAIDTTRARDAHERCRKFESAPLDLSPEQALAHVEARAADLAQARPEYNHATNAMAFVGRRAWSRGLFLDRRAFLVSYDPATDADGSVLAALLGNVVPVGAGINLEYWFSTVDNAVYGCGTKLPHNVASLVGVMDGHASDLRTGLNQQMIEIHEPVRLLCVVEASPRALLDVAAKVPAVGRLVVNEWVQLASLDPETGSLQFFRDGAFHPWRPESERLPQVSSSQEWYRGTRGLLPPASIGGVP